MPVVPPAKRQTDLRLRRAGSAEHDLSPGYDAVAAAHSNRRAQALELSLEEAERGPSNEPLYAIPMTASASSN